MDAIASYVERHLQVKRTFSLYADRVEIHAKWLLGREFRMSVPLASLKAGHREITIRNRHYKTAKMVAGIGLVLIAMAVYRHVPGQPVASPVMMAGAVILGASIAMALKLRAKIIFCRFDNHEGTPGLDIARIGPDRERFDEFVGLVQKQIRASRK